MFKKFFAVLIAVLMLCSCGVQEEPEIPETETPAVLEEETPGVPEEENTSPAEPDEQKSCSGRVFVADAQLSAHNLGHVESITLVDSVLMVTRQHT